MIDVVSAEMMQKSDAATIAGGIPAKELVCHAGYEIFNSVDWHGKIAVVCGSGNNGADGYVLASRLHANGYSCTIYLVDGRFTEEGSFFFESGCRRRLPYRLWKDGTELSEYDMVVDCIFGTGFHGEPMGNAKKAIDAINRSGAFVVSVDINSGLNGSSGRATCAVRSDLTVSIGTRKTGHFLNDAKDYIGRLVNRDIGIRLCEKPYHLVEEADVRAVFGTRKHHSNKSTYGYIALVGGSECYSGAIRLAALAESAMRSGAGVTTVAAPRSLAPVILPAILESTFYPLSEENGMLNFCADEIDGLMRRVKGIAFGMGCGNGAGTVQTVEYLLSRYDGVLILDADGLNALAKLPRETLRASSASVILTPHPLEFARLSGKELDAVLEDPIASAREYAAETGAIVLLKGTTTVVSDGDEVLMIDRGCPGMATAGSGDVLSGILAAICGVRRDGLLQATAAAAFLNGYAGELAERESCSISMTAGDTARMVKKAVTKICSP